MCGDSIFTSHVCEEWKKLDGDIVAVGSVNPFKMKLEECKGK